MIVLTLLEQLSKEIKKELLIVDCFAGAAQVSARLSELASKECTVQFTKDEKQAFNLAARKKYKKLFMDSDVGFYRNLTLIFYKLMSNKTMLAVYEEGLGTYRDDLYFGMRKIILKIFGCGVNFGGNWLTRELYVYKKSEVRCINGKLNIIEIQTSLDSLIKQKRELLIDVFHAEEFASLAKAEAGAECIVYLTGWAVDEECLEILGKLNKKIYVKLHPHIKNKFRTEFDLVNVDSGIPGEIILNVLCLHFEEVLVIHHGSSVDRYAKDKKIKFIRIDSFKKQFQEC